MKKRLPCFVGIDVSKAQLDIACRPEPTRWRVANDSAGMADGLLQLRQLKPTLIALEATGGLAVYLGGRPRRRQAAVCRGEPASGA